MTSVTFGTLGRQGERDRQDASVVRVVAEALRQHRRVGVVELDADGAAGVVDGKRLVEAAVHDAEFIEAAEGRAGKITELGVVALGLELRNDDQGKNDLVLREPHERGRVCQEDGCIENVRVCRVVCARLA